MAENYVLLERIELASNVTNVTFSNIPQSGYTDLKIVASMRVTNSALYADILIRPNGSSSSLSCKILYGNGAAVYSASIADSYGATANGATSTSNTFSNVEWYFPNYTSSTFKSFIADSVWENNGGTASQVMGADLWSSTAAISSLQIDGSFVSGSTFSIYGLAAVGTAPTSQKANGGTQVYSDGTYWYHIFTSSGPFYVNQGITCDYLVVAGGGSGGGSSDAAGGGGAGGFRTTVGTSGGGASAESPISVATGTYNILVGAGGAGLPGVAEADGNNGSNSVFSTITAIGGGGGAKPDGIGLDGGSGGGGGFHYVSTYAGGSGTANQGYAGGSGATGSNFYGGGGGGASAAGTNGSTGNPTGGAGLTNSITGTSITYAGGGGGGKANAGSGAAGGSGVGGTGGTPNVKPTSGVINTGSGGGGARTDAGYNQYAPTGSGGSGVVIIRYAV